MVRGSLAPFFSPASQSEDLWNQCWQQRLFRTYVLASVSECCSALSGVTRRRNALHHDPAAHKLLFQVVHSSLVKAFL